MKTATRAILLTCLGGTLAASADPYAGYCYPAGIQAGTTNRFIIGGQRLAQIKNGWISGGGAEILKIEHVRKFPVPNGVKQSPWLHRWMNGIIDGKRERPPFNVPDRDLAGWTRHPWWETMDTLPPLEFSMVAHYLLTPRNSLQMSPALSERLIVTIAAAPDATPGVRDLILFDGRGSTAPRPFFVSSEPHAAEPLFTPSRKSKKEKPPTSTPTLPVGLPIVLDGQILPGETDAFTLSLDKGTATFLLTGRELQPYLGDAVPGFFNPVLRLTDERGRELAFADDFSYLPDPVMTVQIPTAGRYRLEVRDNLFRGRDDFVYAVTCIADSRPDATPVSRAFACYPIPATHARLGTDSSNETWLSGIIKKNGQCNLHSFTIEKPGDWDFELFARRQGSPLDGVIKLYGTALDGAQSNATLLATWDDATNAILVGSIPQTTCDPTGHWRFDKPGKYSLTVGDRVNAGGAAYRYDLRIAPTEPSFDAYATKSSVIFHRGGTDRASFKVKVVRRNGFKGAVTIDDTPDLHFTGKVIPAGKDEATVVCKPSQRTWVGTRRQHLTAHATVSKGKTIHRPVVPADEAEQAFAYTHLLPARSFLMTIFRQQRAKMAEPVWIDMPHDAFMPPRVLRPEEASVASVPTDLDADLLRTRFATPVTFKRDQTRAETYAFEPESGDTPDILANAVLSGINRFITRNFVHADGDMRRVRFLAHAAKLKPNNDLIFFVPDTMTNSFAGVIEDNARRLYESGYCFDFATETLLARTPFVKSHSAIFVPKTDEPLPTSVKTRLDECEKALKIPVFYSENDKKGKGKGKTLKNFVRRENMPKGIHFARFSEAGMSSWYFVHNATSVPTQDHWRFSTRHRADKVFALDPNSGKISAVASAGRSAFDYTLPQGASVWFLVMQNINNTSL